MTLAHVQHETLRLELWFPDHTPRAGDPHYCAFHACREKLKAAGKLVCWICGKDEEAAGAPIQLHHAWVEQALINGVDVGKFMHHFPEFNIHDEEAFYFFCQSEGNLLALCSYHHIGPGGVHSLPYPCWVAQAYFKDGLPLPGVVLRARKDELPAPCVRETLP